MKVQALQYFHSKWWYRFCHSSLCVLFISFVLKPMICVFDINKPTYILVVYLFEKTQNRLIFSAQTYKITVC